VGGLPQLHAHAAAVQDVQHLPQTCGAALASGWIEDNDHAAIFRTMRLAFMRCGYYGLAAFMRQIDESK
jgi:hypothetical protein